ncbi:MAG TPA: hypothetical protein VJ915_10070 [Balneolaceae bacterium]|nr:hypothetical protein [Balneolaceae bacterium]
MNSEIFIAIIFTFFLSIVIFVIDLTSSSERSRIKPLISFLPLIYFTILFLGNVITTLTTASFIATDVTVEAFSLFQSNRWFWYSVIGVFCFEAIIQNINITYSEKGVLTISDWISKAKDRAVAKVIEKNIEIDNDEIQLLSGKIQQMDESEINTHILDYLGSDRFEKLKILIAENPEINSSLIKSKALAQDAFDEISSVLRSKS